MTAENNLLNSQNRNYFLEQENAYKFKSNNPKIPANRNSLMLFGNDSLNYNYPFSYQNFDLHGYFVKNPKSSFLIKVKGDSMIGAGINNTDVLLVDRSANPMDGSVIVAEINGKLVVKRLQIAMGCIMLKSENRKYKTINIEENDEFKIWGVVQSVIKTM